MKKTLLFMTILCGACIINPPTASATGEWEAAAGFLGGVLFKSAIDNNHHHHSSHHRVYTRSHVSVHSQVSFGNHHNSCHGYWKTINDKRWIGGWWKFHYDECGRQYKTWQEGHWYYYTRQVWVSYR